MLRRNICLSGAAALAATLAPGALVAATPESLLLTEVYGRLDKIEHALAGL